MSTMDGLQGIAIGLAIIFATGAVAFGIAHAAAWRTQNFTLIFNGSWVALNLIALGVVVAIGVAR